MFRLLVDGHAQHPETVLYSDAGTSENADMVQASRSIVLHLKEGQTLSLEKMDLTSSASPDSQTDKRLTFCVSLKHLDRALGMLNF